MSSVGFTTCGLIDPADPDPLNYSSVSHFVTYILQCLVHPMIRSVVHLDFISLSLFVPIGMAPVICMACLEV